MIRAADLFCGAGGTSTGLAAACLAAGRELDLLAVNHWQIAVDTHTANHPGARHLCASLETVNPRDVVPGGRLNLLVASPECTHHSNARGGRPMHDQSRASAWHVLRWAEALYIDSILIENVREFASWGPLGVNGRPLVRKRGETFHAFLAGLRSLGYRVEHRILNAADYGDPTSRQRLFVIARRGNRAIRWPEPTHGRTDGPELFRERAPWRAAREIIDWSIAGNSIFGRKHPLSPRTIERIAEGLRRFGGAAAEPFLVLLRGTGTARSLDLPLPSLTAGGEHVGLAQPFLTHVTHGGRVRSIDEPLPTVTCARRGEIAIVEPFLVPFYGERPGQSPRTHAVDEPIPTLPASPKSGLCEPFVLGQQSCSAPRDVSRPLPTISTAGAIALVEPFLTTYYGSGAGCHAVDDPAPTVTTRDRLALCEPGHDGQRLDIRFRMLRPHELAAAMGFPAGYRFAGNRGDAVRQIGNAVPVGLAQALCAALIAEAA